MARALSSTLDDSPIGHAHQESAEVTPADSDSSLQNWLSWQCKMIDGIVRASLFTVKSASGQVFAEDGQAHWPLQIQAEPQQFLVHANTAVQKRATLVNKMPSPAGNEFPLECISIPIPLNNPRFVLSMLIAPRQPLRHGDLTKLIEWGSHWLSHDQPTSPSQLRISNSHLIDARNIAMKCAASESHLEADFELVGSVTNALSCERVSVGYCEDQQLVLRAISGLPNFDRRMQLVRQLENVMQEAFDQQAVVDSSGDSAALISYQHREYSTSQSLYCISIPLSDADGVIGVMTLERQGSMPCQQEQIRWLKNLSTLISPILRLQQSSELSGTTRIITGVKNSCAEMLSLPFDLRGKRSLILSLSALLLLAASLVFHGDYRVTSNATIEGADKQVVVAPYAGFILSSAIRAGDEVEAGQVLASLDTSALQVEKEKWLSELSKLDKAYAKSLAQGNRIELSMAKARREELSAELQLVNQRLERSQLKAPFRGVVVKGDLNQLLGAPVEQGQVLFEIASMDQFRLMLDIDEQAIASIKQGQQGIVRLAAMPGIKHQVKLKTLQPVAVVIDGKNVFRMEAELHGNPQQIRPGMHGVAKIHAGERSLFWLWTHKIADRIRLWLWYAGF